MQSSPGGTGSSHEGPPPPIPPGPRTSRIRIAVVGSGPAGLYTAEALVKQAAALPAPVRAMASFPVRAVAVC